MSKYDALVTQVLERASANSPDMAWEVAKELLAAEASDRDAARALIECVDRRAFSTEHSLHAMREVFANHADDDHLLLSLGLVVEFAHELRFLNGPAPTDPYFGDLLATLRERAAANRGKEIEQPLLEGLVATGRILGRAYDDETERGHARLVEILPDAWHVHYSRGLFYKVRGRFVEGIAANQRAAECGGGDKESVLWNLGICATGAREGATALAVWKKLGQHIEMGRFGLPEGRYGEVKVRLAQFPLAERDADQLDPGAEETIWIERLSPCHGVVRSALYQDDVGIEFGDVVLTDGAPITHHQYDDQSIPVFPHLVTLEHAGYRVFPFVALQPRKGVVMALSRSLPDETVLYPHTEQVQMLCTACANDPKSDHAHHEATEHQLVFGKLCSPPDLALSTLRAALDAAVATESGVEVLVPDLSEEIGDEARAEREWRRVEEVAPSAGPDDEGG